MDKTQAASRVGRTAAAAFIGALLGSGARGVTLTGDMGGNTVLVPAKARPRPAKKRKGKHSRDPAPWKGLGGGAPPTNGARECARRKVQAMLGALHDLYATKDALVCAYNDRKRLRGPHCGAILRKANMGTVLLASERGAT